MPVDDTIYSALAQAPRSALDYSTDYAKADALRQQNALQALALQQTTQSNAANQGIRNALQALGPNAGLDSQIGTLRSLGTPEALKQADTLDTAQQSRIKTGADANKANADAGATNLQTAITKANKTISDIAGLSSPSDAATALDAHLANGDITPENYQAAKASIPTDPTQFPAWRRQMLIRTLGQKEQLEALTPKTDYVNTGGAMVPVNTNANAGPMGPVTGLPSIPRTASPDTLVTQQHEDSRAAQSRGVQLRLGGYDANGNMLDLGLGGAPAASGVAPAPGAAPAPAAAPGAQPGPTNVLAGLVDSIGQYKSPESVALSRVPPALKSQVLAAVQTKYPDYDPSVYAARQASSRDFSSAGASGKAVKSFNVALDHLDTLQDLTSQLNNGSIPLLNAAGNYVAQQTGGDAQTNLNAAKSIVMNEVVKATSGVAGAEGDRDRAQAIISSAGSPEQLAGAIKTVKTLMAGQLNGLQRSYQVNTGRNDFQRQLSPTAVRELSAIQGGSNGPNPGGISGLDPAAIAAELARRGH